MGGKKKRAGSITNKQEDVKPDIKQESVDEQDEDKQESKWRYFGKKKNKQAKGVVYVSCLPHGFYEKQLEGYFGQFGKVTGVYVPKSKKTGKSKGFAFVEFLHPEVAQVAAETMNNYLVFNRLIKTEVVPPEKQRSVMFKQKYKEMKFRQHDDKIKQTMKKQRSIVKQSKTSAVDKMKRLQESLRSIGVDYKFKVAGLREDVKLTRLKTIDPEASTQLDIEEDVPVVGGKKGKKRSKKSSDNTCQTVALPSVSLVSQVKQDTVSKTKQMVNKKKKQVKDIVMAIKQVNSKADNKPTSKVSSKTDNSKPVSGKIKSKKSTAALSSPISKRKSKVKLETTV